MIPVHDDRNLLNNLFNVKSFVMKKTVRNSILILLVTTSLVSYSFTCSKSKDEDSGECKTCKAYGTSGLEAEETVCGTAAESTFREQHAGKEISCH